MTDYAQSSTAFGGYHQHFKGSAFGRSYLIISSLLVLIALWFSGLRGESWFVKAPVLVILFSLFPILSSRVREATEFEIVIDPFGDGLVLDGVTCSKITAEWRGPVVFLLFDGRVRKIASLWNDQRRREFKLALVHWNTTLRNQTVAT